MLFLPSDIEGEGVDRRPRRQYEAIKAARAAKKGIRRIARELQTRVGTVLRSRPH
jgi:hypothetical protein